MRCKHNQGMERGRIRGCSLSSLLVFGRKNVVYVEMLNKKLYKKNFLYNFENFFEPKK